MKDELISRQAAIDRAVSIPMFGRDVKMVAVSEIKNLSSAQPEVIYCKDCKYFELDHFEKVEGFPIPIIIAHEICMKWGEGCQSSVDGWCFKAERREE